MTKLTTDQIEAIEQNHNVCVVDDQYNRESHDAEHGWSPLPDEWIKEACVSIKEVRERNGLTQQQIASYMGMSQHRVSEIERGVDGRSETKQQRHFLDALEVIVENDLLDELNNRQRYL